MSGETEDVKDLIYKLKSEELSYEEIPHEKRILIFEYCKNNTDDSFHLNLLGILYSDNKIGANSELSLLYYEKAIEMGDEFAKYNLRYRESSDDHETIFRLRKLNSKLLAVKLKLGDYLIETGKYSEALKVLSKIVNEKFYNYGRVMWNLHTCYRELKDINLSFFYFKKSLLKCSFEFSRDTEDIEKSISYFPELQIVNKDSTKCVVKITHYLGNILNVNLIELIVDYFE